MFYKMIAETRQYLYFMQIIILVNDIKTNVSRQGNRILKTIIIYLYLPNYSLIFIKNVFDNIFIFLNVKNYYY